MIRTLPPSYCQSDIESDSHSLSENFLSHWYVVHSKPRGEKLAGFHLSKLGIETFCPNLLQRKQVRRKLVTQEVPLFPGYLFAKFDPDREFRTVQYGTGVRCVVCFGKMLARIDARIIDAMRERIYQGYFTVTKSIAFQPGQKVRIQNGPLQGFEAVFECEMSDQQRVALLLKTVAYQARVVVQADQIAISVRPKAGLTRSERVTDADRFGRYQCLKGVGEGPDPGGLCSKIPPPVYSVTSVNSSLWRHY